MPAKMEHPTRLTLIATCLAFVVVLLDTSIVNVAINTMRTNFHADISGIQWIINAYSVSFSALLLTAGILGDRFGCKPVFLTGFALFTFGSLCCALSSTLVALIASRIIQGAGAALLVPASLSVIRTLFAEDVLRARAIGWWGASGGIALAAGPVIGGLLVSHLGWSSIFLLNIPLGIFGFIVVRRYAPETFPDKGRSMDIPGQLTGILMLSSLTYGLIESSHYGWTSLVVLISFSCAVIFGVIFILIEFHHPQPMLPLQLFRNPVLSVTTVTGLVANLAFYGMIFVLSLYFQSVRHLSPEKTGLAFLPMMAVLMLFNIISGRLIPRIGAGRLIVAGLLISASGYALLLLVTHSSSPWNMAAAMLLAGSGIALSIPAITNVTLSSVSAKNTGMVSGLLNAARQVGGVIGVALFGTLINGQTDKQFMHGMHASLMISSGLLMGSAWLIFKKLRHSTSPA